MLANITWWTMVARECCARRPALSPSQLQSRGCRATCCCRRTRWKRFWTSATRAWKLPSASSTWARPSTQVPCNLHRIVWLASRRRFRMPMCALSMFFSQWRRALRRCVCSSEVRPMKSARAVLSSPPVAARRRHVLAQPAGDAAAGAGLGRPARLAAPPARGRHLLLGPGAPKSPSGCIARRSNGMVVLRK